MKLRSVVCLGLGLNQLEYVQVMKMRFAEIYVTKVTVYESIITPKSLKYS